MRPTLAERPASAMLVTSRVAPTNVDRYVRLMNPSPRKLAGIALIMLLIIVWAAFVAGLARIVGQWPVLAQAPFYLVMGLVWIVPLKPLIRWIQTDSRRVDH